MMLVRLNDRLFDRDFVTSMERYQLVMNAMWASNYGMQHTSVYVRKDTGQKPRFQPLQNGLVSLIYLDTICLRDLPYLTISRFPVMESCCESIEM